MIMMMNSREISPLRGLIFTENSEALMLLTPRIVNQKHAVVACFSAGGTVVEKKKKCETIFKMTKESYFYQSRKIYLRASQLGGTIHTDKNHDVVV